MRSDDVPETILELYYARLLAVLGPQRWWPARTRLEVILGAILTQNTAWTNAASAIKSLRKARLLSLSRLRKASPSQIEECVRPAGFYRQKAATIRNFLDWLERAHGGSLAEMFRDPAGELRRGLLAVKGLGLETADAILLYAGRRPYFVADAYTRRVLSRHGLTDPGATYAEAQDCLHRHVAPNYRVFNEFHALLVEVGKRYCKRAPHCAGCPLEGLLPPKGPILMSHRGSTGQTVICNGEPTGVSLVASS